MAKSAGTADLVTFTEEILKGKLHFLCSGKTDLFLGKLGLEKEKGNIFFPYISQKALRVS